jgi:hypothetical protein
MVGVAAGGHRLVILLLCIARLGLCANAPMLDGRFGGLGDSDCPAAPPLGIPKFRGELVGLTWLAKAHSLLLSFPPPPPPIISTLKLDKGSLDSSR